MFGLGLGWIPTLFNIVTTLSYVLPYIISTSYGHVAYIFPAISDSGVHFPESLIFRELLNLSAFLSLVNIYVRYKQYQLILASIRGFGQQELFTTLNFACSSIGIFGGIALTFVANFKSKKVMRILILSLYLVI